MQQKNRGTKIQMIQQSLTTAVLTLHSFGDWFCKVGLLCVEWARTKSRIWAELTACEQPFCTVAICVNYRPKRKFKKNVHKLDQFPCFPARSVDSSVSPLWFIGLVFKSGDWFCKVGLLCVEWARTKSRIWELTACEQPFCTVAICVNYLPHIFTNQVRSTKGGFHSEGTRRFLLFQKHIPYFYPKLKNPGHN